MTPAGTSPRPSSSPAMGRSKAHDEAGLVDEAPGDRAPAIGHYRTAYTMASDAPGLHDASSTSGCT